MLAKLLSRYNISKIELVFLLLLIVMTSFMRLDQLGYSHFYGDETKVLYLRKDTSAKDFLLNQRKGPVQFVAAWSAEKAFGEFDELTTRLPFALASIASVLVLYLVVKALFGRVAAATASLLFSLNGFFVAFGRTVQYQSFLLLFGLLSILFAIYYLKSQSPSPSNGVSPSETPPSLKMQRIYLFFSGVFLALAYLSHWDAVFFDIAVGVLLIRALFLKPLAAQDPQTTQSTKSKLKDMLIYLLAPFLLVAGVFYIPYFTGGYFSEYVSEYISRRVSGSNQLANSSFHTFYVYNKNLFLLLPLTFLLYPLAPLKSLKQRLSKLFGAKPALSKLLSTNIAFILIWFAVPFILFQFLISNPGTHIYNYLLPLLVLAGVGASHYYWHFVGERRHTFTLFVSAIISLFFLNSLYTYIPRFNMGYPWNTNIKKDTHQLFLYGFPYYRGWDIARDFINANGGARSFYTNDNVTIGEYYLQGVAVHKPAKYQRPQYYIYVRNGQEFTEPEVGLLNGYELQMSVEHSGVTTLEVYKSF